jgi:hypothetical protein
MSQQPADLVFSMLAFQYKPLEKKLLAGLEHEHRKDLIAKYKAMPTSKKIIILDRLASQAGL